MSGDLSKHKGELSKSHDDLEEVARLLNELNDEMATDRATQPSVQDIAEGRVPEKPAVGEPARLLLLLLSVAAASSWTPTPPR